MEETLNKNLPARPNLEHLLSQAKALLNGLRQGDSQSPATEDYLNIGTVNTGQLSLGIMEWIGHEVCFCMAAPGTPRPSAFGSEPGSGVTVSRWRRK